MRWGHVVGSAAVTSVSWVAFAVVRALGDDDAAWAVLGTPFAFAVAFGTAAVAARATRGRLVVVYGAPPVVLAGIVVVS